MAKDHPINSDNKTPQQTTKNLPNNNNLYNPVISNTPLTHYPIHHQFNSAPHTSQIAHPYNLTFVSLTVYSSNQCHTKPNHKHDVLTPFRDAYIVVRT